MEMNNTEKLELIEDLFEIRKRITWLTQKGNEATSCFGKRALRLLTAYTNSGKLAQLEIIEILQSPKEREKFAITCFVQNLRKEIKRYMCQPQIYESL